MTEATRTRESDDMIARIPASCICTWERKPGHPWERITPREDCPWHTWDYPSLRRRPPGVAARDWLGAAAPVPAIVHWIIAGAAAGAAFIVFVLAVTFVITWVIVKILVRGAEDNDDSN